MDQRKVPQFGVCNKLNVQKLFNFICIESILNTSKVSNVFNNLLIIHIFFLSLFSATGSPCLRF